MSKHTPGPWTVVSEGMVSPKVVDANGLGICHTTYAPTGAEANARLIAAAPDLLEALKAGPSIEHTLPTGLCACSQCQFVRMRSAAIAKAEGTR